MELWSLLSITAPGSVPAPAAVHGLLPPADRERPATRSGSRRLRRRMRPMMLRRTKEQVAADLPPKQEQVLARRPRTQAPQALRDPPAAGAAEGARAARRLRPQPVRDLPVAHPAAPAQPARRPRRRGGRRRRARRKLDCLVEQLRGRGRRGPPRAGVQPVHRLPRAGCATGSTRRASATATSTGRTRSAARVVDALHGRRRPGVPDQPQGGRLRAEPDRGRLLLPARPLVEPGRRGAGGRPHAPDRPDAAGDGLPAGGRATRSRRRWSRCAAQGANCSAASSTTATVRRPRSPRTTSAGCSRRTFSACWGPFPRDQRNGATTQAPFLAWALLFLAAAFLAGVFLAGVFLGAAFLAGALRGLSCDAPTFAPAASTLRCSAATEVDDFCVLGFRLGCRQGARLCHRRRRSCPRASCAARSGNRR